jgi:hypothetical protein
MENLANSLKVLSGSSKEEFLRRAQELGINADTDTPYGFVSLLRTCTDYQCAYVGSCTKRAFKGQTVRQRVWLISYKNGTPVLYFDFLV